jgi:hypothetical protein
MAATALAGSDHVILPPPSARNPLPSLPAALRIDNKERLLEVLLDNPSIPGGSGGYAGIEDPYGAAAFRQLLVFGKDSLRTLLMRQVLQDPHTRTFGKPSKNAKSKTNKNWDDAKHFPLPRILQNNVVGTRVLLKKKQSGSMDAIDNADPLAAPRNRTAWKGLGHEDASGESSSSPEAGAADSDVFWSTDDLFEHVDVITYIVRPWDLDQTMAAISRIKQSSLKSGGGGSTPTAGGGRTHKQHHRIVYVPKVTAMCSKILTDHGVWNPNHQQQQQQQPDSLGGSSALSSSVSVVGLQLDLFPLASDLLSLEYEDGLREAGNVGGIPSGMIETTSRALSKLQDVVGRIPRIQSLGIWGEDVLDKLLNETVDDYWAARREENGGSGGEGSGGDDPEGEPWEDEKEEEEKSSGGEAPAIEVLDLSNDTGVAMVLIDRRLDMVTPMVTPLTYEGLLDELVGIDCAHVEIREDVINPPDPNEEEETQQGGDGSNPFEDSNPFADGDTDKASSTKAPPKASLGVHEGDTLYAEVRDQHVEKFGSFLQNQAVALKESHANFTSRETKKDLDEIEKFVKQIPVSILVSSRVVS